MAQPGLENPSSDESCLHGLIARACEADEDAWQRLWESIDPLIDTLVRRRRLLGHLSECEDDRRGVVLQVMAKLRQDGFRRLKLYREQRAQSGHLPLAAWLAVVARNTAIDCLRAHPDYVPTGPRHASGRPGGVEGALPLPSGSRSPGARPPITLVGTAGQLLEYARRELPARQCRALELWLAGHTVADIAGALAMSAADEADRMVRAAVERLRRHFRTSVTGHRP